MLAQLHDSALDGGARKRAPGTQRFCAVTGAVRPVEELMRFVIAPDGTAVPDLKRRLPGRGIWITATRQALRAAMARKTFARGFKREVRVASDLVETTERLIERAALDALAMCHKGRSLARRSRRFSMLQKPPPTACESSRPRFAGARISRKSRSSMHLPQRNWIWHWGGQM
jgi:predicted RNA-binding protein YlxR (DUF448 family)